MVLAESWLKRRYEKGKAEGEAEGEAKTLDAAKAALEKHGSSREDIQRVISEIQTIMRNGDV